MKLKQTKFLVRLDDFKKNNIPYHDKFCKCSQSQFKEYLEIIQVFTSHIHLNNDPTITVDHYLCCSPAVSLQLSVFCWLKSVSLCPVPARSSESQGQELTTSSYAETRLIQIYHPPPPTPPLLSTHPQPSVSSSCVNYAHCCFPFSLRLC